MSVRTLSCEPCPSVPRSRLIIPFSVVFFHFHHVLSRFELSLATILELNVRKTLATQIVVRRPKTLDEAATHTRAPIDDRGSGARQALALQLGRRPV